uniref:Dynamin-type G domain-containing protein n=1 Tax=Fagus sylvatica TaxID=28930 RepID=A0A2N9G379_FAGSY
MITREGIQLPTIVVVGDQSSGKSSVLESLAGINLPRGLGICTRVPLIMRLQHQHQSLPQPELVLEFNGKVVKTDEEHVSEAIIRATDEIAGLGKGISNTPLTLEVRKNGVPDLTMVDLPGITRVPVHGQPEDIYDQIRKIIMEYITPEESIILNVLSATVDFTTCESIRMSQMVDKTGERTLAVVTKSDKAPEGLLEKVTADDVNIGLGYVCVRNRIGDESYEEARVEEAKLFETHPMLSKIDKSIVGVPVLAQRLEKFDEYPDEKKMHCTARLVEMLNQYSDELHRNAESNPAKNFFDGGDYGFGRKLKVFGLPNFLPRTAFLTVLPEKSQDERASSVNWVMEIVEMEKQTDYTCNPEYLSDWNKLMGQQDFFMKEVLN